MIPLRDDIPSRSFPLVTIMIIGLNVLAFLYELGLGRRELEIFALLYGVVPARYTVPHLSEQFSGAQQLWPFVTSMFLHGGWTHLIGNMWSLWIFGDNVEDRLGRIRFLVLYGLGGLAASLMHIFTNAGSTIPAMGASGAIAAVMGAYLRLYPHARVQMLFPPFFLGPYFVVPAGFFLVWWFMLQFFNGTLSLFGDVQEAGGIAWWAHIGGFVFGAMLCSVIKVKKFYRRDPHEDLWRD